MPSVRSSLVLFLIFGLLAAPVHIAADLPRVIVRIAGRTPNAHLVLAVAVWTIRPAPRVAAGDLDPPTVLLSVFDRRLDVFVRVPPPSHFVFP
jgi:hypothetical protein